MTVQPLRFLADVDQVVLAILRAHGIECGPNQPDDVLAVAPYVTARRFGGLAVHPKFLDKASIQIDAYAIGPNRHDAANLAETCRVLLWNAHDSQKAYGGGTISHYAETTAPIELATAGQPKGLYRFHAVYSLHVRPSS